MQSQNTSWVTGKTVMITGANSGIGKAGAIGLARMGAKTVMISRDPVKAEAARTEVLQASGARVDDVSVMIADLASMDSVRRLAKDFLASDRPLHVLVNNAGLILGSRKVTPDGLETTFEVNYLSHFLLTNLLLGNLKASAPSRIINVSSHAHNGASMNFDDLQGERSYSMMKSYSQSKLAQVLFTRELAERLKGTDVTVNAVHPGAVATNWGTHSAGLLSFFVRVGHPFMIGPEKGADTVVYLASSPDVANATGEYFVKRRAEHPSKEATDEASAKKLWDVSARLTGLAS